MFAFGPIQQPIFRPQTLSSHSWGNGAGAPANLFTQSISSLQLVMLALMTQMMAPQVAMPGVGAFGGRGQNLSGSPLSGFLGNSGAPNRTDGSSELNTVLGQPDTSLKGKRIKGGKANYKHGMFHKGNHGAPDSYAFENSPQGIAFAAKKGYSSIDIDMQITKDGVPVATHWSQPLKKDGFYDPRGKLKPGTKVSDMTLAEVMRLRNKNGQSRIYPMATMVKHLKKHGIAGDFEAKNDHRFAGDKVMGYLAGLVHDSGIKANLKSIDRGSLTDRILKKAQEWGFWVRTAEGNGHAARNIGYA